MSRPGDPPRPPSPTPSSSSTPAGHAKEANNASTAENTGNANPQLDQPASSTSKDVSQEHQPKTTLSPAAPPAPVDTAPIVAGPRPSFHKENGDFDKEKEETASAGSISERSSRSSSVTPSIRSTSTAPSSRSGRAGAGRSRSSLHIARYMSSDVPLPSIGRANSAVSTASSTLGPCDVVPVAERRGLFARLSVVAEVTEPLLYAPRTKWLLTLIVAVAGSAAPMGGSIIMPAVNDIAADLGASKTVTNLSVALYMLSMSICPLWWSSLSEKFGRRTIYLISFSLFTGFAVLSAISTNIAMFIVMRALSGGAAASVQAVGAGTISDLWEPRFRGRALGIFYLGPLCGPLIAPIMGGAMTQQSGWRTTQWFLTAFGAALLIMILFALPETLRRRGAGPVRPREPSGDLEKADGDVGRSSDPEPSTTTAPPARLSSDSPPLGRVSTRQSIHEKAADTVSFVSEYLVGPLKIVLLLRFPPVLLTVMYASFSFGVLYFLNISIVNTFSEPPYNWPTIVVGLAYIPNGIGFIISSIFGGRWLDYVMKREAERASRYDHKGRLIFLPEDRMQENFWLAAALFPIALLVYGWTANYGVFWLVPLMANFFFGLGVMLVFGTSTTMLTEFMPAYPSHGVALNNFVRNIFSCLGTLLSYPILRSLGNGQLMSILSGLSLALGFTTIMLMKRYSKEWRERYGDKLGK